jgi:hypothetical protein
VQLAPSCQQTLEGILAVHVIQEHVFAAIAPAHDVINRPGILNSHFGRHQRDGGNCKSGRQDNNELRYGLTPSPVQVGADGLLQHPARLERGLEHVAVLRAHGHEGEAVFLLAEAEHGERCFHRDGVRLEE